MEYSDLFKILTRLCAEMIASGGSGEVIPLRINYICSKYGLNESQFIIAPNGVYGTASAPDGSNLTAIRSIGCIGQDFGKLQRLDDYCSVILKEFPSAEEIRNKIEKINKEPGLSKTEELAASIMLGTGFAALFGCSLTDTLIAIAACVLIVLINSCLKRFITNLFFNNTVICLAVVSLILVSSGTLGICTHPESVTLGVIMLLISGLSFSDGLWSLINKDISIGIYKLNNAVIGAIGIVIGTATSILLIGDSQLDGFSINAPLFLQILECIIACSGFAILCNTRFRYVPAVGLGAGLSWMVYVLISKITPSLFISMAVSTFTVTLYALFCYKKWDLNPNITRAVGILPLVPGTNLFYMLYASVTHDFTKEIAEGTKLVLVCLGISFGFTLGILFFEGKIKKIKENAK